MTPRALFTTVYRNSSEPYDYIGANTRSWFRFYWPRIQSFGLRFLKHVERTRFLVHILSIEDVGDEDPWAGFTLVNEELRRFDEELGERRQLEVVNKIDLVSPERLEALQARAKADGREIYFISARDGLGLEPLVKELWQVCESTARNEPIVRLEGPTEVEEEEFPEIEVIYTRE